MPVPDFSPGEVLTAAAMDQIGLWLVGSQTVGTGVAVVDVTSVFSASYDVYYIQIAGVTFSASADINARLLSGSTAATTNYNFAIPSGDYAANAFFFDRAQLVSLCRVGRSNRAGGKMSFNFEVGSPFLAEYTLFSNLGRWDISTGYAGNGAGMHQVLASYNGIQISAGAGTMTGGKINIYGYRN